jgi:acid phosphatase family membrane protein YuiD
MIEEALGSGYLIAIVAAWLVSHTVKYLVTRSKGVNAKIRAHLFVSGGMPSAHTSSSIALLTIIGLSDGVGSGLFGLAALFTLIVMYDSMKIRRSSGEQGLAIKALIKRAKIKVQEPFVAKGHTQTEVIAGAVLGFLIGLVVFFATS